MRKWVAYFYDTDGFCYDANVFNSLAGAMAAFRYNAIALPRGHFHTATFIPA